MSSIMSVMDACGNSCLLLFPAPQTGCFSRLPAHAESVFLLYLLSLTLRLFCCLPLPIYVNVFFVSCILFLSPFLNFPNNMKSSNRSKTTLLMRTLTQISSHAQTHTHTLLFRSSWHTLSHFLLGDRSAQLHRESRPVEQPVVQPASKPEGCDIAVKGPEEVDNSTASGMLGSEGRNEIKILPAARRLRDGLLTAEETG